MNRFYRALEAKYQAGIEESLAILDLYFSQSVGVGEHPDIIEVLDTYMNKLNENKDKLETLKTIFRENTQQELDSETTDKNN